MPTPITASTLSALLSTALAQSPPARWCWRWTAAAAAARLTLANALSAQLPGCTLLRTDDFYCRPPGAARTGHTPPAPTWTLPVCGTKPCARLRGAARGLPGVQLPGGGLSAPGTAARAAAGDLRGQLQPPPAAAPYETLRVFVTCTKGRADPALTGAGGRTLRGFCRPVGSAGGGVFCAV